LVPLTSLLYNDRASPWPFAAVLTLWVILGVTAVLTVSLAVMPWPLWRDIARALGGTWGYAAFVALLGTGAWQWSERLWKPTAALTFDLVRRILVPIIPTLTANASTRVLRTDRFAIEVTQICSGLEGMGLMLAFTIAWLLYFRREYIFPRALVLIPAGLAAMFALNVLVLKSPVRLFSFVVRSAVKICGLKTKVVTLPEVVAGIFDGELRGAIAWSDGL